MSPLRAAVAAALLLGVPLVAGVAFGVPTISGIADPVPSAEQTPGSLVEDRTATPGAADRQTPSATAEAQAAVDDATAAGAATEASATTEPAASTATSTRSNDPNSDAASTSDATESSQENAAASQGEAETTVRATDTPTETPVATDGGQTDAPEDTETPTETATPIETATSTPTDAPDAGDEFRQCTVDRDGHEKPALPDPVSPPDDAQSIESGAPVSGSVGPDETRWYAVEVQKGESLSVVTEGSPESLSLAIFAPDGSPVDALETRTPDRTAFGATADRSGTYYVRVSAGDGYGGFYRLTAETAGPDQFDPNDSMDRALPVASGSSTDATLAEGEVDWYAIKLDAGDSLLANVTVNGHALGRDVRVDVYGPDGGRVGQAGETRFDPSTGTNRAQATATASETGVYYVRVHCAALDGHAPYTLDVNASS